MMMKSNSVHIVGTLFLLACTIVTAIDDTTPVSSFLRTSSSSATEQHHQPQQQQSWQLQECVPCSVTSTAATTTTTTTTSSQLHHHRQLQLFPKLLEGLKSLFSRFNNNNDAENGDGPTDMIELVIESDFFAGNNETAIGQFFQVINSSPLLQVGAIGVGLIAILVLISIEVESIVDEQPIICLLNLFDTTPLYGPCSGFERRRRTQGDSTFLPSYFNGTVESLKFSDLNPISDGNKITTELMKVVNYGLSGGVFEKMNNVTLATVIDRIANSNSTRPFLAPTVLAMLPVLMINSVKQSTCTGANCARRQLQQQEDEEIHHQCERKYIHCEINNIVVLSLVAASD